MNHIMSIWSEFYFSMYSSISDISPRHLAFEKRKIPSKTAYHVLPIYEKKKNSVQDVLIMSYPFPKMVVSIKESPRHLSKISRTFQDISFQVTYREQKFPGHLYFSKILSKMLLSCPTLISEIEEYLSNI